ncbi:uncharacterized protein PV09_06161 [Verruconis gallopava]|uniref:LYC1 C-terminal domain-containing protein n=1 Tax=Verruconis gallopava TaxID=253628 RepID=A0A0D1YQ42_9PEZI|nr:uncharacterized protein PV09_06161 [Verruconis gallopava]KIW02727.1 hypothetical protein PV09_06161 [Verruconis gallopava]
MDGQNLDFSCFTFQEATIEERYQCWRSNSESWAGKLSVEDHVAREEWNGKQSLTRDGGQRYWVFKGPRYRGAQGETNIYSSVETLKKEVVLKFSDGTVKNTIAYGIASVFTAPEHRGKGVAAAMMERLGQWLDGDEAGCELSILYSDIGEYYARLGWPSYSSLEVILPSTSNAPSIAIESLTTKTVKELATDDVKRMNEKIISSPIPAGIDVLVGFLPTYSQAEWHFASEEFTASKLFNDVRIPFVKGAMNTDTGVWAYWTHDFNDNKLTILRIHADSTTGDKLDPNNSCLQTSVVQILGAAQKEAHDWGLDKVVIWNPNTIVLAACAQIMGRDIAPRKRTDSSVPCLRWKRREEKKVSWYLIEKYSWC